jgi:hypothetical protein
MYRHKIYNIRISPQFHSLQRAMLLTARKFTRYYAANIKKNGLTQWNL